MLGLKLNHVSKRGHRRPRMYGFTRLNGGAVVYADCGGFCGWCYAGETGRENGNIKLGVSQDQGTQIHLRLLKVFGENGNVKFGVS